MKYLKPPKELQQLFNHEWSRAKRELAPLLDNKDKPRLYVAKSLRNGWVGLHQGGDGMMHKINGKWLKRSAHIIVIRLEHLKNYKVLNTVRHEICHVLEQNHRARFHQLLKQLR